MGFMAWKILLISTLTYFSRSAVVEKIDVFKEAGLFNGSHTDVKPLNDSSHDNILAFHFGWGTSHLKVQHSALERFRAAMDQARDFTISAWIKLDVASKYTRNTIVCVNSMDGTRIYLWLNVRAWKQKLLLDLTYQARDDLLSVRTEVSRANVVNQWSNISVRVQDREQVVRFYVNDKMVDVKKMKYPMDKIPPNSELRLGQMFEAMSEGVGEITRRYKGYMADVKITFGHETVDSLKETKCSEKESSTNPNSKDKCRERCGGNARVSSVNCTADGAEHANGTTWDKDECTRCECKNGSVMCTYHCACQEGDTVYFHGDRWYQDNSRCVTCECKAGKKVCSATLCQQPNCTGLSGRRIVLPGQCCPICEEHQCRGTDKIFNRCGTMCPWTCTNLYDDDECPEICNRGCFCPPGLVLNRIGKCVRATRCSCDYEGKRFSAGQQYSPISCMKCTCLSGRMRCIKVCDLLKTNQGKQSAES